MALSDLILNKGQVIVSLSSSVTGLVPTEGGQALSFGYIQKVNDLSSHTVGTYVMFNIENSIPFQIISGTIFLLINEIDIQLTEIYITPP